MVDTSWLLHETGCDAREEGNRTALYAVGNGYMGLRASLEEDPADAPHAGCFVAGLLDGSPERPSELLCLPHWLGITLYYDGDPLTARDPRAIHTARTLDMQHAQMMRETVWSVASGELLYMTNRFVSAARPHLGVLEARLRFDGDRPLALSVETGIDSNTRSRQSFSHVEVGAAGEQQSLIAVLRERACSIAIHAQCQLRLGDQRLQWSPRPASDRVCLSAQVELPPGVDLVLYKFVSVYNDEDDFEDPLLSYMEAHNSFGAGMLEATRASNLGYLAVLAEHERVWRDSWRRAAVDIDGDDEAQQAVRFCIYHLLSAAPAPCRQAGIAPYALTSRQGGSGMRWDTETALLPFFTTVLPEVARRLLALRVATLDAAREYAARTGFAGACYEPESAQHRAAAPSGFVATRGPGQHQHKKAAPVYVAADVAQALWSYFVTTGDFGLLLDGGAEVIFETARFWHSRALYSPRLGRYEIWRVTGPDTYHPDVDNSVYVNWLARHNVRLALRLWRVMHSSAPQRTAALVQRIQLGEAEVAGWKELADKLHVPAPDPASGVIPQFDHFLGLENVDAAQVLARQRRSSGPGEAGGNTVAQTQVSRHAEVLLLLLRQRAAFDAETKQANYAYYEPRIAHLGDLDLMALGVLAADLGFSASAYQHFMASATADLQRVRLSEQGVQVTGCGAAWAIAVLGLGGLHSTEEEIVLQPQLPAHWQSLSFGFAWHGSWVDVRLEPRRVVVGVLPGGVPVPIRVEGNCQDVAPGRSAEFILSGG